MANITGRITINAKVLLEVDAQPGAAAGTPAPIGSIAMYDSGAAGSVYIKTAAADTAWSRVDVPEFQDWEVSGNGLTGGTPETPNEWMGSNNDYDVVFQRDTTEAMRLISAAGRAALLVGTDTQVSDAVLQVLQNDSINQIMTLGRAGENLTTASEYRYIHEDQVTTDGVFTSIAAVNVEEGEAVYCKVKIVAVQTGGSSGTIGSSATYERTFLVKRLAAGQPIIIGKQNDYTEEEVGESKTWKVRINAGTGVVDIEVQGDTDKNVAWKAQIERFYVLN